MHEHETATDKLRIIMGDEGLARLQAATVMVFGCGGVGSSCVEALARGCIGRLVIVDKDVVAPSNINRQAIAFTSTVGRRKIDVMSGITRDLVSRAPLSHATRSCCRKTSRRS